MNAPLLQTSQATHLLVHPTHLTEPAETVRVPAGGENVTFRRNVLPSDDSAIREIVTSTGFFSKAEIDIAVELAQDRLVAGEDSDYHFLLADVNGRTTGYTCYGEISCTVGSYDLYWIAVRSDHRRGGLGKRLLAETERLIAQRGGRRIYVDTSSRDQYEPTRAFYSRCGYRVEAIMNDFYAPGDGKVVLVKTLAGS